MTDDLQGAEGSKAPALASPRRGLRWLWFLLGGAALVGLLCCGGFGLLGWMGLNVVKQSDPYRLAWEKVRYHPKVIEKLGEPIEEASWFPTGEFHIENGSGEAKLVFQIKGPKGTADVQSDCRRVQGKWGGVVTVKFRDDERLQLEIGSPRALSDAPLFTPDGESGP